MTVKTGCPTCIEKSCEVLILKPERTTSRSPSTVKFTGVGIKKLPTGFREMTMATENCHSRSLPPLGNKG
jgi:hypothetical protein